MIAPVYLDACIIIDLVEGAPEMQCVLRNAIRERKVVSTELARLESRIGALRRGQMEYLDTYRLFFESCRMQPLDRGASIWRPICGHGTASRHPMPSIWRPRRSRPVSSSGPMTDGWQKRLRAVFASSLGPTSMQRPPRGLRPLEPGCARSPGSKRAGADCAGTFSRLLRPAVASPWTSRLNKCAVRGDPPLDAPPRRCARE